MHRLVLSLLAVVGAAAAAFGHFVFVTPGPGGATAQVFISETLTPDLDANIIAGTKLSLLAADGSVTPLTLSRPEKTFFAAPLAGSGTRVVFGAADLGVMSRGGGKPHLLIYYPKTIVGDAFDTKARVGDRAPVELIPVGKPGQVKLRVMARGKALADSEVTVILPDGSEKKMKTDASGETAALDAMGRYGAWARFWEAIPGEQNGKKYEELRNYATLVFDVNAQQTATTGVTGELISKLPQATASFGATTADGWLYVYGGHVSPTHSYFKEAVSGRFDRMSLAGEAKWESLADSEALQGMNLASYKGKVYRVGGMAPRNERGQAADNHSTADVAYFDPATKKWQALPSLPQARSSHDVSVVGDKLIVIGGWSMEGKSETWRDTVEILDLAAKNPVWKSAPQPFQRRALMTVALNGKVYAIGGMNDKSQVERKVSVFDPATSQWQDGPELPAGAQLGFAPAAGLHKGKLYVSLADGSLLRLDPAANAWELVTKTSPRVAHRLASRGDAILLIGGAAKGKNLDLVEEIKIAN